MKILITILLSVCVFVCCKFNKTFYASCKDYCTRSKEIPGNMDASVRIKNRRCHNMYMNAMTEGEKLGVCYDGPSVIDGVRQDTTDPDPVACQALIDQSQEACKKLPPDPSQMNQTVSGTTIFKGGKPVLFNGEPVKINGEICTCNQSK